MIKRLQPLLCFLFYLPFLALANQASASAILPPEQAFPASATATGSNQLRVFWNIHHGYYLYRNRFHFKSDTKGITLGQPVLPRAEIKNEGPLGEKEVFTHPVNIQLPVTRAAGAPNTLIMEATAQGCAEQGVCYPPFSQKLKVVLPLAKQTTPPTIPSGEIAALTTNLNNEAQGKFLQPDQAFKFSLKKAAHNELVAHWIVAPGYHLYRDQIKFTLLQGKGLHLGKAELPPGQTVDDPVLGREVVYAQPFDVTLPILRDPHASNSGRIKVRYQGCADKGICYAPITKTVDFNLPQAATSTRALPASTTAQESGNSLSASSQTSPANEQDRLARFLLHRPLWMSLGLFFILGVGLAFTPCVFPLFPILSGIIVGQRVTPTPGRTFILSLVYVLAMALTYTIVGIIVGLTGAHIQAWFQNPWVLSAFAAIFVLLALSMFGFYELQMPSFVQSRITEISNRQQGGTLLGVSVMGFLSALIVGPCVTAPLVATLIVIAKTGNAFLGGSTLFALSMGMGLPLLVICTACGRFLPKAGPWMDSIKAAFGVLMLGIAIWMLSRFLPYWTTALLTGVLVLTSSVYLGAFDPLPPGSSGWHKLWKGFGLTLAVWGISILVGIAAGGNSVLTPLQTLVTRTDKGNPVPAATQTLPFSPVRNTGDLNRALHNSKGKPVMLDFYADWCVSCKELETYTFSNPRVQQALSGFTLLQVDVTANSPAEKKLLNRFGLYGPPGIIFFNAQGHEMKQLQVVGFMSPTRFIKRIDRVGD